MNFKTKQQSDEYYELRYENPRLRTVLYYMDCRSKDKFGVELTVTSIWRDHDDPYGLHRHMRAADVRIYYAARDGKNGDRASEITEAEMLSLADETNTNFKYGNTWRGAETQTVKVRLKSSGHHDDRSNDHAHVQTSEKGAWK